MTNMTIAIPNTIYVLMRKYSEIKWSEVARKAIERRIIELERSRDPLRTYALKHALERGWSEADELFKF